MKSTAGKIASSDRIAPDRGEEVATLILDERGMIRNCSRITEALFEYRRSEMAWRHVSMLLPQLANLDLLQNGQLNARLRFLSRIGRPFEAVARGGKRFACELFLNLLGNDGHRHLTLIVRPAETAASERQGRSCAESLRRPFLRHVAGHC